MSFLAGKRGSSHTRTGRQRKITSRYADMATMEQLTELEMQEEEGALEYEKEGLKRQKFK